jgi:hypothetical protein
MHLSAELAKQLANLSQTLLSSVVGAAATCAPQQDDVKSYAPSSTDWEGAKEAAGRLGWQLRDRLHNTVIESL